MKKWVVLIAMLGMSQAMGDGYRVSENLSMLVSEIQRLRTLNNRFMQDDPGGGIYGFRYDLVDSSLAEIMIGIEHHLRVVNSAPQVDRLRITQ